MPMKFLLFAGAAMLLPTTAGAATVVDTLPYQGTPGWTDIVFGGTTMTTNGTTSTLATTNFQGVWFGWGAWYGDQPGWTPGTSAAGNYLSLTAAFSPNAADWSAYFYDQSHAVSMLFAPTPCPPADNCYNYAPATGVNIYFRDPLNSGGAVSQFVSLDPSLTHTYEFLLKGGAVSYRIDGTAYTGLAQEVSLGAPLLVIGDGSGSSPSGVGSMKISGVQFDNAYSANQLSSIAAVPEPATWAMMLGGFGLAGASLRRRRSDRIAALA